MGRVGIGPVDAAQAIVSYAHRDRCRDDAAFAALTGASPLQASSGRIVRLTGPLAAGIVSSTVPCTTSC
ncbi:transposase [Pseudonocardia halophobica]|uniref:transposase n=1 Tax=Pseudonocardia halophobica TaxID=29401 RepID=UPI003D946A0D